MIKIQNIYYMLSYAFQVLREETYRDMETEQFHNTAELMAAILSKGFAAQVKRGLQKEYIQEIGALNSPKGKIEVSESIKELSLIRNQLVCMYDDFSVNSYLNRIVKTTMELLLAADISAQRRKEIRRLLSYLADVESLETGKINWKYQYNQNNQTYRMLIGICYLTIKGLLQTENNGRMKLMDFLDEQRMSRLYEKFLLEYYRKEHPELKVSASQITWNIDDGTEKNMLPVMQSDIMLERGKKTLIIDAKYYQHTNQSRFDVHTVHSGNLYQIYTYVKNKDRDHSGNVAGMLLYAQTDDGVVLQEKYSMDRNQIYVRTLDLGQNFKKIEEQLDGIAEEFFEN